MEGQPHQTLTVSQSAETVSRKELRHVMTVTQQVATAARHLALLSQATNAQELDPGLADSIEETANSILAKGETTAIRVLMMAVTALELLK